MLKTMSEVVIGRQIIEDRKEWITDDIDDKIEKRRKLSIDH